MTAPDLAPTANQGALPRVDLSGAALFLDFDGTLVDLADTPHGVAVPETLIATLRRLEDATGGATAIVTGRDVKTAAALLAGFDGIIAGSHGAEMRRDGTLHPHPLAGGAAVDAVWQAVADFAEDRPGMLAERKTLGAGLHFRQAPDYAAEARAFVEALIADHPDFEVHPAKMAFELRPEGIGKDHAIADLLETPPFAGRRPMAFGDDTTDEPALRLARDRGGLGFWVGGPSDAADYCLADPAAVHALLARWLEGPR